MTAIRLSSGRADARNKNSGKLDGTLPATGDAGDCGEIPSFEFKLRVRGLEKT